MMKKTLITAALLALSSLAAHAHEGAKPRFGGVVASASDLAFELVSTPQGAAIYIEDHGKPLTPAGIKGKIMVLDGSDKSEAELSVAGDRLEARGVRLRAGAKVVAALNLPTAKVVTVRFSLR